MQSNLDKALKEILRHEGGFVNHPKDPGGMTNLGVTKATYEAWVGYPVSEQIMRGLTPQHVRALYKKNYWDALKCDDLPAGVDLCVFDFGVNAGTRRSARYLQTMISAKADGVIGKGTLLALQQYVRAHNLKHTIDRFQDIREGYYKRLKTFPTFGRGWLRRVEEVRQAALKMAG